MTDVVEQDWQMASRRRPGTDKRCLTILGATGSIGQSTLDLVMRNPDRFEVEALTAANNVDQLAQCARKTNAKLAVIANPKLYDKLKQALAGTGIETAAGPQALIEAASRPVDLVMAAIVGAAGLAPTLAAVEQGTTIGLANKECLVSAGDFFMGEAARSGARILPVDSEHNAIFQVLPPEAGVDIEKIILTASGGPFRTWSLAQMAKAQPKDALKHPNWSMGRKLTIDSATMINKGLELIEAYHLFPVNADQLDVLVHPQSIVHSMVECCDGSVLAQMGMPDMRTPIAYTLTWPGRMATPSPRLDLKELGTLTFEGVDHARFPAVDLALSCLKRGDGSPTVLNAANEVAVERFLKGDIGFLDIVSVVDAVLNQIDKENACDVPMSFQDVTELDMFARECAGQIADHK